MIAYNLVYPFPNHIGHVETISPPLIQKAKRIKKVKIQEEWLVPSTIEMYPTKRTFTNSYSNNHHQRHGKHNRNHFLG